MHKIRTIIHYELTNLFSRKSYLRMVFILPLIGFLVYSAAALVNRGIAPEGVSSFISSAPVASDSQQGVLDQAGIITAIPPEMADAVMLLDSQEQGQTLVADGQLSAYYVIAPDYLQSGDILFVQKDYNFLATQSEAGVVRDLITWNLFSDKQAASRYLDPMQVDLQYTRPQTAKDFGGSENFWLPYGLMMLFYLLIIGSSSLMLNSITYEKQNRVIEVLLTSYSSMEMLIGKTIALGLAGLFQTLVWTGSGFVLLTLAGRQFSLPASFSLSPSILVWGVVFFCLGYALYSSLMAGLGALVPNPKEGSQATLVVIFPLLIPLFFSNLVATAPNAPIFVFFSLFPFTSPISMISRMSATAVPLWQTALSVFLLLLTIVYTIRSVARIFRAQALLAGKPFKVLDFVKAFRLKG
ncbi:MAG: type transport system permease protein [Chloroflexota bacterium]|nr:type transport system permease protein [Chloroflexota bacterium]